MHRPNSGALSGVCVCVCVDPIIGIDVTADGKWILATCRNYLLVASTALERGTTGFEVLFPSPDTRSCAQCCEFALLTNHRLRFLLCLG